MSCKHCTDPNGDPCYPQYGTGPHKSFDEHGNHFTEFLPKEEWPENYREDPDCPGCGIWWCPVCGDGKPED